MTHDSPRVALFVPDDPDGDRVETFRRELSARLPGALVAGFTPATAHHVVEQFPDRPDALVVGGGDLLRLDVPPSALAHEGPYPPLANLWLLPALLGRASVRPRSPSPPARRRCRCRPPGRGRPADAR